MSYVKWFIFTLIFSFVVGFGLAYLQQDKEYETTVEIQSNATKQHLGAYELSTFPKVQSKYNQTLTGKGKMVFESELYSPIFVRVKAEGYKTKYAFYVWKATDENIIYLDPLESTKTKTKKTKAEPTQPEEKKKVDMLPAFK